MQEEVARGNMNLGCRSVSPAGGCRSACSAAATAGTARWRRQRELRSTPKDLVERTLSQRPHLHRRDDAASEARTGDEIRRARGGRSHRCGSIIRTVLVTEHLDCRRKRAVENDLLDEDGGLQ